MKLTLPIDDPFWNEHHPSDRWNCKCSLEATDEPEIRPKELEYAKPQLGLESNPGKTGEMFSNTHPYYPNSCNSCPFNKGIRNKAKSFFRNENKHCNTCSKIQLSDMFIKDSKYGERLMISKNADQSDLNDNKRVAKSILSSFSDATIVIREHILINNVKKNRI